MRRQCPILDRRWSAPVAQSAIWTSEHARMTPVWQRPRSFLIGVAKAFPIDFWIGGLRSYEPTDEKNSKVRSKTEPCSLRLHLPCAEATARLGERAPCGKRTQHNLFCAATPRRNLDRCRMTPVQTQFTNMYDGAFTNGGIVPWVSPADIRIGEWDVIVDPRIAGRARRRASATTGAPATIDAPAAIAGRSANRRTRKVHRSCPTRRPRPARDGACALSFRRQTRYRLGPL